MDKSEVYLLLNILKEAMGHPNYANIRNEAAKRLQAIDDEIKEAALAAAAPEPAPVEKPKAFPSKPEAAPEESSDDMRRV